MCELNQAKELKILNESIVKSIEEGKALQQLQQDQSFKQAKSVQEESIDKIEVVQGKEDQTSSKELKQKILEDKPDKNLANSNSKKRKFN